MSAVESTQNNFDEKSSEGPIGSICKQKVTENTVIWVEVNISIVVTISLIHTVINKTENQFSPRPRVKHFLF